MATTMADIRGAIKRVLDDDDYYGDVVVDGLINDAWQAIAGGVLMPDGDISPPLPGLCTSADLTTSTTLPYISLPDDYQRNVFYVSDNVDYKIHPVNGGDFYSFTLFLNTAIKKDLSLAGIVTTVCVNGNRLYYQGIPAAASRISIRYYKKPAIMVAGTDVPEGLPDHLSKSLIKHYVCKEVFGEGIEDGENSSGRGQAYHEKKFYEAMTTLVRFIGTNDEPVYYGAISSYDTDEW